MTEIAEPVVDLSCQEVLDLASDLSEAEAKRVEEQEEMSFLKLFWLVHENYSQNLDGLCLETGPQNNSTIRQHFVSPPQLLFDLASLTSCFEVEATLRTFRILGKLQPNLAAAAGAETADSEAPPST